MRFHDLDLELLGHDSIRIIDGKHIIYSDPFKIPTGQPHASIILITHPHYDHCSIEDIKKLSNEKTIIITVPDTQSKLSEVKAKQVLLAVPGKAFQIGDVHVKAVPAYNVGKAFHVKEQEWVGYLVTVNNTTLYIAGDTDVIPEMKSLGHVDVAFLPVSGTYVMTAEEAAQAAMLIKPEIAIPMHYGSIVGTKADAERFKAILTAKGLRVEII